MGILSKEPERIVLALKAFMNVICMIWDLLLSYELTLLIVC